MRQIKVLGIGSPFGDDRAGWEVVLRLQRHCLRNDVAFEILDRPGLGLLEHFQGVDVLYLIDAVQPLHSPGMIHVLAVDEVLAQQAQFSTHGFGVAEALQLAKAMNGLPAEIHIYGIEMASTDALTALSAPVAAAVERLAAELVQAV